MGQRCLGVRIVRVSLWLAVGPGGALWLAAGAAGQDGALFTGLGDLRPPGDFLESMAYDVSADGLVVVGRAESELGTQAFRWTMAAGMEGLGDLPGGEFLSEARGVSADGSVVVGKARSAADDEAFVWTSTTGMVEIGGLAANDVSADGAVVVGFGMGPSGFEAFRWTQPAGRVGLGLLPGGVQSFAEATSTDGSVVVGRTNDQAFLWTESTGMIGLGDLGSSFPFPVSEAFGVSPDGSIVVGGARNAAGHDEAFVWTAATGMVGLGILPGRPFNAAADLVSDGSVVVGLPSIFTEGEAFIWDAGHGLRSLQEVLVDEFGLDLDGWHLVAATGISDDGRTLVGYGTNPTGRTEAWVATLGESNGSVEIDVLPFGRGQRVLLGSRQRVLVAILGSPSFDVAEVDVTTLGFGPDAAPALPGPPAPSGRVSRIRDANGDGFADLLVLFDAAAAGIPADATRACVTGALLDGASFEGCDAVLVTAAPGSRR